MESEPFANNNKFPVSAKVQNAKNVKFFEIFIFLLPAFVKQTTTGLHPYRNSFYRNLSKKKSELALLKLIFSIFCRL